MGPGRPRPGARRVRLHGQSLQRRRQHPAGRPQAGDGPGKGGAEACQGRAGERGDRPRAAPRCAEGTGREVTARARLILTLALPALVFYGRAGAEAPARLTAGYSTNTAGQSVLWIANDAGLYQKNGREVKLVFVQSAFLMTQALIAGDLPVAAMGGGGAVTSNLAGSDLVIVASLAKSPNLNYLVTRKEITRPEQLKGKRLGAARLGGASDSILRLALKKTGLDPDRDATILQIGFWPPRIPALVGGALARTSLHLAVTLV